MTRGSTARMDRATPPADLEAYAVTAVGCLWRVEPRLGRLSLSGDATSLGLDPHDLHDALPDLVHAARPEERATLDAELRRGTPGAAFGFRLHLGPSSIPSLWRGRWDAEGATAEAWPCPTPHRRRRPAASRARACWTAPACWSGSPRGWRGGAACG